MADGLTDQYTQISMAIVNEAINYAKSNEFSEDLDVQIRQIRVVTQVLLSALQQAAQVQRPLPPPPTG